jgi:hypothetical protein
MRRMVKREMQKSTSANILDGGSRLLVVLLLLYHTIAILLLYSYPHPSSTHVSLSSAARLPVGLRHHCARLPHRPLSPSSPPLSQRQLLLTSEAVTTTPRSPLPFFTPRGGRSSGEAQVLISTGTHGGPAQPPVPLARPRIFSGCCCWCWLAHSDSLAASLLPFSLPAHLL